MKLFKIFRKFKFLIAAVAGFHVIVLFAARLIDPSSQPLNYVGMGDLNTFNLSSTSPTPVLYSPWFENGTWVGDLIAYPVSGGGVIGATPDWKARDVFADPGGADADNVSSTYWSATAGTNKRMLITTNGGGWTGNAPAATDKIPFRYNDYATNPSPGAGTVLTQAQQDAIAATVADQQNFINFVRGDRSNEGATTRTRGSILGDIIHSAPEYVGAPSKNYTFSGYAAFKASNSARAARVYVGANDGMLHAFDAANGQEVFAYIPSMLIPDLAKLTVDPYVHTYFVDGELASGDAYAAFPACGGGSCWRTVLVGGLGAGGGKGFYALDVTTPVTTADTEDSARAKILWEIGAPNNSADPKLGYTYSRPRIARLKTGQWVAIAGNGYDSTSGHAVLYIIDIDSGDVVKVQPSGQAVPGPTDKNGLSSPTVIDSDFDGDADFVYAGDLNGHMWRFDLTGVSSTPVTANQISYYKLYPGSPSQAITAAPDISRHPDGDFIVFFGTGRDFNDTDAADTTVQAIYGIRDQGAAIASPSLVTQTLTLNSYTGVAPALAVRVSTSNAVDYTSVDGWQVDLPAGERLFDHLVVRADRVQFTSTNPTTAVYENWLMQLDYLTGGPPQFTVFDLNQDGSLNSTDNVDGNSDGDTVDPEDTVVAQLLGDGLTPLQVAAQPLIAFKSSGVDTILINSLGLPVTVVACTFDCASGFTGGHIDVDTDSPNGGVNGDSGDGLGGDTDGHVHEYDNDHSQVYVDSFSLEPTVVGGDKLNRVTQVGLDPTQRVLILIANADLSPGGKLTIGNGAPVNVKAYQDAIISKIQTGTVAVTDLHRLQDLDNTTLPGNAPTAAGETLPGALRISFTDTSIIGGGLVPTNTGCVRGNDVINDRWRNAALTLQLLKVNSGERGSVAGWVNIQADDPVTPAVETTGVTVSDPARFLYESTLFWHWKADGALAKLRDLIAGTKLPTPCYGDPDWADSVAVIESWTADPLTQAEIDAANQAIDDLNAAGDTRGANKVAAALADALAVGSGGGGGGGGGGIEQGVEILPTGGVQSAGETPGVTINSGQRSWLEMGNF